MLRTLVPTVVLAAASACQSYDLEPVNPLAFRTAHVQTSVTALKARPDLMLMVDQSRSMYLPVNPADARCPVDCGTSPLNLCPSTCPTRWSELKGAMDGFLTQYGMVARMGLTPFAGPVQANDQCVPGMVVVDTSTSNDVPSELQASAAAIDTAIAGITPAGGTPTGTTLRNLAAYAPLANPDRDDYVLLLTDGLPNCNPDNPHDYNVDPAACRCTSPSSATCAAEPRKLCLDQDATVGRIGALQGQGVKTVVVGFGAETASGDGPAVLSAMGAAGGYPLTCPHGLDSECAGGTCNVGDQTCSNTYYQAGDRAALSAALARLAETLNPDPCHLPLPLVPSDARLISVVADGLAVASGSDTWQYVPPQEVELVGALCTQAQATTSLAPMKIEIGVAQPL